MVQIHSCIKKFTLIHHILAQQLSKCLEEASMRKLKTKGKAEGSRNPYYRPITCLSTLQEILSAQVSVEIYYAFECGGLFLKEQRIYHKGTRGTDDLLCTDQHILEDTKEAENITMAWPKLKKVYNKVQKTWIIESREVYKSYYTS